MFKSVQSSFLNDSQQKRINLSIVIKNIVVEEFNDFLNYILYLGVYIKPVDRHVCRDLLAKISIFADTRRVSSIIVAGEPNNYTCSAHGFLPAKARVKIKASIFCCCVIAGSKAKVLIAAWADTGTVPVTARAGSYEAQITHEFTCSV